MEWLPPSTDLNPIENLWSIVKRIIIVHKKVPQKQRLIMAASLKNVNALMSLSVRMAATQQNIKMLIFHKIHNDDEKCSYTIVFFSQRGNLKIT